MEDLSMVAHSCHPSSWQTDAITSGVLCHKAEKNMYTTFVFDISAEVKLSWNKTELETQENESVNMGGTCLKSFVYLNKNVLIWFSKMYNEYSQMLKENVNVFKRQSQKCMDVYMYIHESITAKKEECSQHSVSLDSIAIYSTNCRSKLLKKEIVLVLGRKRFSMSLCH